MEIEKLRNKFGRPETLCVYCGNACRNGCSWASELIPVEGWNAVQNKKGWFVIDCPEYCGDEWMRENASHFDEDGCVRLVEAMIRTLREDYIAHPKQRRAIEAFIRSPRTRGFFFFAGPDDIIDQLKKEIRHTI